MGQNASIPVIQHQPSTEINVSIFDGLTNDAELMIAIYNEEFPLKPIKTMEELPIPNEIECNSVKNTIQIKIDNGENLFDIINIECFMLNNNILPTLVLKLIMVNYKLFDKISSEMNINKLLIDFGLEKTHGWYFWKLDSVKEKVIFNNKEAYLYQLSAYQL